MLLEISYKIFFSLSRYFIKKFFLIYLFSCCSIPNMEINTKKIEKEIERLGMTRKEFAAALGMHLQGLEYILRRKQTRLTTIQHIADYLGLDGKDLLT